MISQNNARKFYGRETFEREIVSEPSRSGLAPSAPARRGLGEEIGRKYEHWLIEMQKA